MILDAPASEINWNKFTVPEKHKTQDHWQCPYMEQYLNETGTERICPTYQVPAEGQDHCRVAFYIYRSFGKTLHTPYGDFRLLPFRRAPKRLREILEFTYD